jgi:serine protease Do
VKLKALLSVAALAVVCAPAPARAQSAAPPSAPARTAAAPSAPTVPPRAALAAAPDAPAVLAAPAPQTPSAPPQTPAPPAGPVTTFLFEGNFLGVRTEEVTRENASRYGLSGEPRGVGVREVVKGSPAEKAGVREGDVILRFDGEQVSSARKLTRLVEEAAPQHAARLTVLRGGSEQELSATLARRQPFAGSDFGPAAVYGMGDLTRLPDDLFRGAEPWEHQGEKLSERLKELQRAHPGGFVFDSSRRIGVATSTLSKQLADYFGVARGVLVNSVEADSPADKAGLKAGDVVTEIDGKQIEDTDDLVRGLGAKDEGEVTLTVVRDRKQRTVRLTPERRQSPGINPTPGSFRVIRPPAASLTTPRVKATPLTALTPGTLVTPRVINAPRLRATPLLMTAPRVGVLGPVGRVL